METTCRNCGRRYDSIHGYDDNFCCEGCRDEFRMRRHSLNENNAISEVQNSVETLRILESINEEHFLEVQNNVVELRNDIRKIQENIQDVQNNVAELRNALDNLKSEIEDCSAPEKAEIKINGTKESLNEAVKLIKERAQGNFDRLKGGSSFLKSNILKPLFYGLLITDRKFRVSDACIGCGICAKSCPLQNITMQNDRPKWNGHCTNCMSCYHRCPKNAINFGKASVGKGQYFFNQA